MVLKLQMTYFFSLTFYFLFTLNISVSILVPSDLKLPNLIETNWKTNKVRNTRYESKEIVFTGIRLIHIPDIRYPHQVSVKPNIRSLQPPYLNQAF